MAGRQLNNKNNNNTSMILKCYKPYMCSNRALRSLTPFLIYDYYKFRPAAFHFYSFFLVSFLAFFLFFSAVCTAGGLLEYSSYSLEEPQFYTIQAGSYAGEQEGLRHYQKLADTLPESLRSYLRVEKVGRYYTVRVGKFEDRDAAEEFYAQTEQYLPKSIVLQAYIKDERIFLIYQTVSQTGLAVENEEAVSIAEQESPVPLELSPEETGMQAESTMEANAPVVELIPDASVAAQEDPGLRSIVKVETVVTDDVQHDKEMIGQMDAVEEDVAVVADPGEISAEDGDGVTEGVEAPLTVGQQAPEAGDDEPAEVQEEVLEEQETKDTSLDQERQYEDLGQPTGINPVRVVAIIEKDIFGNDLRYPHTVHYDPVMDEIYVLGGSGKHPSTTIMIYGPDYFPVAALGKGRGVGLARGVALDADGNLYVTIQPVKRDIQPEKSDMQPEKSNIEPCLKVLNPAFFLVDEVICNDIEEVPDNFWPKVVAVSEQHIYLTGEFVKGVLVFDRNYKFIRWLVPMGKSGKREQIGDDLAHPKAQRVNDVVVDRNGRIYILCPDLGRIFVLDAEWNFLFAFGVKGGASGKLSQPRSIAVDVDRQVVYVVDYMRHTIVVYNYQDGKLLFEFGGLGDSPGWFQYPNHVAVDRNGHVLVADFFGHKVQVLLVP